LPGDNNDIEALLCEFPGQNLAHALTASRHNDGSSCAFNVIFVEQRAIAGYCKMQR